MADETTETKIESGQKPDIRVKVVAPGEPAGPERPPANGQGNHLLALVLLSAGLVVIFGTGLWLAWYPGLGYTAGGSAACAGVLFFLALLVERPTLIMDDAPEAGGEPSTMRILTVIIVLTFAVLMLRTGWNTGSLPSLENQGNWVWLVTAALGGKALQKFAEVQEKNK